MSHNPKINIYTIELNKKDKDSENSFKEFFKSALKISDDDEEIFDKYSAKFINFLGGKDQFISNKEANKVFGFVTEKKKTKAKIKKDENFIEGILEGGKFGIKRNSADIKDKNKREKILPNNAILDNYYFILKTPLNSRFGYLIIQSYTEESILEQVKNRVKEFFGSTNEGYFNPNIELFIPENIVNEFKETAKFRMFKYSTTINVSDKYGEENSIESGEFQVDVYIKPKNKSSNFIKNAKINLLGITSKFIKDSNPENATAVVYVEDEKKTKANFNISRELESIKPTIYLEDIIPISDEGIPDFIKLSEYCKKLLPQVEKEFLKNIIKLQE